MIILFLSIYEWKILNLIEKRGRITAENELNRFKEENAKLIIDLEDSTNKLESLNRKSDTNELIQKKKEIDILKGEFIKYEDHNRGLKDHVNFVMTQTAHFKQETDQIVKLSLNKTKGHKIIVR